MRELDAVKAAGASRERADAIACSRPEVRDGRYAGHLAAPMIGSRKSWRTGSGGLSRRVPR